MKYIILHGSGSGPDMWLPWLNKELEKEGHEVWMPTLPDAEEITFEKHLHLVLQSGELTPGCILIGHSAGCRLLLKAVEEIDFPINKMILVAGSYRQMEFKYQKINQNCKDITFIVSDNDPWNCGDDVTRPYFDHIGSKMIIIKGGGHFGSTTFKKPLYKFDLLLQLLRSQKEY